MSLSVFFGFVLLCFLPPLVISAVATGLLRRWALHWGLIDEPAVRKVHKTPVPLGGGIALWTAVLVMVAVAHVAAYLIAGNEAWQERIPGDIGIHWEGTVTQGARMWMVLAGGTLLAVMGLLDDLRPLPWLPRLLVQLCLAVAVVAGGVRATVFVEFPLVGMVLTVLWILVLVNAFNFLDNMDGLSSGVALIAAVMFATVMLTSPGEPRWLVGGVLLVLAGSLAGFLFHNWPPARIFMGDSGSYFIGWLLACLTVMGTFYKPHLGSRHVVLAPLCVLAVPLYDFCSVVVIRLREGRSPFHPDKKHFSHRLVELGLQPRNAVLTIHLAALTTGLGALLLYQVPGWAGAGLIVLLIGCVLAVIAILETAGRRRAARMPDGTDDAEKR